MAGFNNQFLMMAARVQQGKPNAAAELHHEMHAQLQRLIRRTLRVGQTRSPLGRRISREAQRMGKEWRALDPDDEATVSTLASRVCRGVVHQLETKRPTNVAGDTWVAADVAETFAF